MPESIPSLRAVPVVPNLQEVVVEDFVQRRQDELLIELDALHAAARAAERKENALEAQRLVKIALDARQRCEPSIIEDHVIHAAMARIIGVDSTPFFIHFPQSSDTTAWEQKVTRTVIRAWIAWAQGNPAVALKEIPMLREQQEREERITPKTGAVNLMAVYIWGGAVEHLARGDLAEASKYWKRAMGVASSFGADASLLIQWTYAASFFPVN